MRQFDWTLAEVLPKAAAVCPSNIPFAVPITNVIARPIPNVTIFGCAVNVFRSFCFIVDVMKIEALGKVYKGL